MNKTWTRFKCPNSEILYLPQLFSTCQKGSKGIYESDFWREQFSGIRESVCWCCYGCPRNSSIMFCPDGGLLQEKEERSHIICSRQHATQHRKHLYSLSHIYITVTIKKNITYGKSTFSYIYFQILYRMAEKKFGWSLLRFLCHLMWNTSVCLTTHPFLKTCFWISRIHGR